jgi:hypothetical protein
MEIEAEILKQQLLSVCVQRPRQKQLESSGSTDADPNSATQQQEEFPEPIEFPVSPVSEKDEQAEKAEEKVEDTTHRKKQKLERQVMNLEKQVKQEKRLAEMRQEEVDCFWKMPFEVQDQRHAFGKRRRRSFN